MDLNQLVNDLLLGNKLKNNQTVFLIKNLLNQDDTILFDSIFNKNYKLIPKSTLNYANEIGSKRIEDLIINLNKKTGSINFDSCPEFFLLKKNVTKLVQNKYISVKNKVTLIDIMIISDYLLKKVDEPLTISFLELRSSKKIIDYKTVSFFKKGLSSFKIPDELLQYLLDLIFNSIFCEDLATYFYLNKKTILNKLSPNSLYLVLKIFEKTLFDVQCLFKQNNHYMTKEKSIRIESWNREMLILINKELENRNDKIADLLKLLI